MQSLDGLLRMVREEALTCGTVTGVPAFTSCQLTVCFGDFGVCAWNSRATTEDTTPLRPIGTTTRSWRG